MEKGTNKAHALKELLKVKGMQENEVAVVGDSGNDIPLFENFENSFVMKQAPEEVKMKAKVTLKSFDDLENYIK
jgi:hydroxymethylpyrimidine pyrophosphatase-like HAD family hydrolase